MIYYQFIIYATIFRNIVTLFTVIQGGAPAIDSRFHGVCLLVNEKAYSDECQHRPHDNFQRYHSDDFRFTH
jgi:hypothetical protein